MIATLNTVDGGAVFAQNPWDRFDEEGNFVGHGITAVLEGGDLIEKGAARFVLVAVVALVALLQ